MAPTAPAGGPAAAPWANLLEPAALAMLFEQHPPQGFVPLRAGAGVPATPAFLAPFDLLTTADDALLLRLRRLPLFARWRGLLRWRTAFVGTTVTEYALLPRGADATALAAAWRRDWGRGQALLIVKDLPQASPLLDAADNAQADAVAAACAAQGYVLLQGQALAYVPIDFASVDDYLARLSGSRRKNLRRKLKSLRALRVERRATGDAAFADEAVVDAYYALYEAVYAQSEVHFDKLGRAYFAAVLRDAGNGGIVFEYRLQGAADGPLIGWNLCFESSGMLIDKSIGLAYPAAREHNLYFVSWMVNLGYALERDLSHYVAGWTDPQVKAQLGARFSFTRHAVYVRNPLLRALARRIAGRFEADATALAGGR
jgi:hypothetical protein